MHRLAFLIATILILIMPAEAAERRLLTPFAPQETLTAAPQAQAALAALRKAAAAGGRVKVIAGLRVPFAPEDDLPEADRALQRRDIALASARLLAGFSAAANRHPGATASFTTVPFVALDVTPLELERLAADPQVISLVEDGQFAPFLAQSAPLISAPEAWDQGGTGAGQTVAVIDYGVDGAHPALSGKIVDEACYSADGLCPGGARTATGPGSAAPCSLAACWHGTHLAGIAAGDDGYISGIAPEATIIAVQVASYAPNNRARPMIYFSDAIRALEHVYGLRQTFAIAAVNLSFGAGAFSSSCDDWDPAMTAIVGNLRAAGIATVAASGNDGRSDVIAYPACLSRVISVGAVSDANWGACNPGDGSATTQDKVSCFSNSSETLSLLAPGALITSSVPGGYTSAVGTSMAAPHVVGALAVLRQRAPQTTVGELLSVLQRSGKPILDYRDRYTVKPRIDVAAALALFVELRTLRAGTGPGSLEISAPAGTATCAEACDKVFAPGTPVKVTARPALGAVWSGWSGPCRGLAPCSLLLNATTTLTANFTAVPVYQLSVQKTGTGAGTVSLSSPGETASCGDTCSKGYNTGTLVKLKATPAKGMRFTGWSGACRGKLASCSVKMTATTSVTASFTRR